MSKSIIVIGGGPGGYVAAIRAAQLGAKVTLIEGDKLGGTCLNRGCIPTKALYRNAEILSTQKTLDEFGISIGSCNIEVEKLHMRKQGIIDQLVSGVAQLLKANNVEVIYGRASFIDRNTLSVNLSEGGIKELSAEEVILATGSKPSIPPIGGADLKGLYTSENILSFTHIPKTLAVLGGGVIGMELACIFNALGTKVTVLEYLPNILGQTDSDITKRLMVSLKKRGIEIDVSTKVNSIEEIEGGYLLRGEGKKGELSIEAEKVLIATGRTPSVEGLNLEAIGVDFHPKGIVVKDNYETNVKGIYAIGDVNGKLMLAHAASHQAIIAAESIMAGDKGAKEEVIPSCIFVFPEVASVGTTEDEAKQKGISYRASKFMFGANGKALALGEGEGFIKVLSTNNYPGNPREDILIGVHVMGPHASDLIHEGTLAIANKLRLGEIISTVHAHPTLSEAFAEAVMGLCGEAIHMAPQRR